MNPWEEKINQTIKKYGEERDALLPCLVSLQKEFGYISEEAIFYLRDKLKIASTDIYSVITFYGMFTVKKQPQYVIRVCNSLPCFLKGSRNILDILEKELGIKAGEKSSDDKFSLEVVGCLGLCDQAPALMVNEKIYGNLTEEKIKELIKNLKENKDYGKDFVKKCR